MKLLIASLVMFIAVLQCSAGSIKYCIFSEITFVNEIIFKFKSPEAGSIFSLVVNESPFQNTFAIDDARKGTIKLRRSLRGIMGATERTKIISAQLRIAKNGILFKTLEIKFYILKEGWADGLLADIIASVPTLAKPSNPFRQTSTRFPWYKKLHSIMMQGTRRSKASSLAECKFVSAYKLLIKTILTKLQVIAADSSIHVGPQGILSAKKLEELIEKTGCIPEIEIKGCSREVCESPFRTIDGTCNNLNNPTFGAAETGFFRILAPLYFDAEGLGEPAGGGIDQPNAPDLPNPSFVTDQYIVIQAKNQPNPDGITHMFMQWGQFLDHDLTLAPESENGDVCENVPCNGGPEDFIEPCFPILPSGQRPCIRLIRSAARCPINGFRLLPREQINVNTAYIDGSMVYGSSEKVANAVRDLTSNIGLLKTSGYNLLPIDNSQLGEPLSLCENLGSCFLAGDTRVNEQAALAAMHTLWVREHNKIARELSRINLHWDSERIYQEARKIVGGVIQEITYEEWLPIAIGQNTLRPYKRYNPRVNAGISNSFATAAFRLGHSLVRPKFDFLTREFKPISSSPVPLKNVFFNNTLAQQQGIDGWLIGMLGNVSQVMDNEMALGLTNQLFQRDNIDRVGLNLAALNMQRGREHGLPFYSDFLRECGSRYPGLYPVDVSNVQSFDDIRELFPTEVFESIKSVYKNNPQSTDLFPAGMGEKPINRRFERRSKDGKRPSCFKNDKSLPDPILGPTFTCLLIDQFERARDGDRFFYKNESVFTPDQCREIERRKLSEVICNNIDVVSVQSAAFLEGRKKVCPKEGKQMNLEPWRERVRSCRQSPCLNGGRCRRIGRRRRFSRYICDCRNGFSGLFCRDKSINLVNKA